MRRRSLVLLFGVVACAAAATPLAPTVAGVQQAAPVLRDGIGLVQEVAKIPLDVGEILLLPMGVVECLAAPLPGVSFMSGLRHLGTGLLAPFCLVRDVLTLPYDVAVTAGNLSKHVAPGS